MVTAVRQGRYGYLNSEASSAESIGRIGGYDLLGELGRGGTSLVFKAKAANGDIVALKLLSADLRNNHFERERFYREAETAMRLRHTNLIRALDAGEDDGRHYIVMEYIEGETLAKHIKRKGKIREQDAIRIILAVSLGLVRAHHEGLIHSDIKPENIILTEDGRIKLIDLGLAKDIWENPEKIPKAEQRGTPAYMAPEMIRNPDLRDVRCDVYALGQTLYVMLTGNSPFADTDIVELYVKKNNEDFPPPQVSCPTIRETTTRAILRAMSADPAKRPETVWEFTKILLAEQDSRPSSSSSSSHETHRESGNTVAVGGENTEMDRPREIMKLLTPNSNQFPLPGPFSAVEEEFDSHPFFWLDKSIFGALLFAAIFFTLAISAWFLYRQFR